MKRFLLALLGVLMICCSLSASANGAVSTKRTEKTASSLYDAEQILYMPASNSKTTSVGYLEDEPFNMGPESFVVEDGAIYILDTVNSRIIIENNNSFSTIDLPGVSYPKHMCVANGKIYVTDDESNALFEITRAKNTIDKYTLPDDMTSDFVYRIESNKNGNISLTDQNLQTYSFDCVKHIWSKSAKISCIADCDDEFIINTDDGAAVTIRAGKNTAAQYITQSNGRIVLGIYEFVPDVPVLKFERTIRFYNTEGEFVGCTLIEENEAFAYPSDDVYESSDGSIYVMHCMDDGIYITRPYLRMEYDSEMELKTQEANELCRYYGVNTRTQGPAITSYTRSTVRSRAMSCVDYSWTFKPSKNATIRTYNGTTIILPVDEAGVTSNKSMTGIPYCRGMHDGPSSFASKLNTIYPDDGLNKYYTAGNVAAHHVYGSTGLDCSGLVCYAYNAPSSSYWTTGDFADPDNGYYISTVSTTGSETQSHIELMKNMDYMVEAGNHIVLYDEWYSTTRVTVIHASRSTYGKAVRKNYKFEYLDGFLMKSPYSCTVGGCQNTYTDNGTNHVCTCSICGNSVEEDHSYRAVYSHSDVYHYHECTKCGARKDIAYHSFVWSGTTYRCSVCGYETNSPITPYSIGSGLQSCKKDYDSKIIQTLN